MTVSGGSGESVMVVVPGFSLREYRPEPRIAAAVARLVSAISVPMADRVDDEGAMPAVGGSETSAPQEQRQAEFWSIEAIPDEIEEQKERAADKPVVPVEEREYGIVRDISGHALLHF